MTKVATSEVIYSFAPNLITLQAAVKAGVIIFAAFRIKSSGEGDGSQLLQIKVYPTILFGFSHPEN